MPLLATFDRVCMSCRATRQHRTTSVEKVPTFMSTSLLTCWR